MNLHTDRLPGARRLRILEERTKAQDQVQQARQSLANYQAAAGGAAAQQVATPQPVHIPGEPITSESC